MTDSRQLEIICSACGADTLVVRKPRYEGFTKVGEVFACASCGHEFAGEEDVPYKERREAAIFSDADRSEKVEVFHEDEKGRICRYCAHYIVNPFKQWCALNKKEVEATDSCPKFARRKEEKPAEDKTSKVRKNPLLD